MLITSLVEMNVAVFVRNSMIMSANAMAQGGGRHRHRRRACAIGDETR